MCDIKLWKPSIGMISMQSAVETFQKHFVTSTVYLVNTVTNTSLLEELEVAMYIHDAVHQLL